MAPLRWVLAMLVAACAHPPPPPPPPMTTPPPPPPVSPPAPATARVPLTLTPGARAKLQYGPTLAVEAITATSCVLVVEIYGYQQPMRIPVSLPERRTVWTADDFRITVDRIEAGATPSVAFHAERVSPEGVTVGEPSFARVERGGRITVSKDLAMTFLGHGHKRTFEGQASPLMVTVAYHGPDVPSAEEHYNAGGAGTAPPHFAWRDYRFTVVDYGYDTFMQLRIDRLAFEPIGLE